MKSYNEILINQINFAYNEINKMDLTTVKNPLVVFDIDGTLISHYGQIEPVTKFYQWVKKNKINTGIITARTLNMADMTIKQLNTHDIKGYSQIYFRRNNVRDVRKAKEDSRHDIERKGFTNIMSIGDASWDIGKYGGVGILLPKII